MKLIKYRFYTKSVEDYRPLIDLASIKMPYWCTGTAGDDSFVIIVCYLPENEDLFKYWDDAYNIMKLDEVDSITYSDRFSKPSWCD